MLDIISLALNLGYTKGEISRIEEVMRRISGLGRKLSDWDCTTGKPVTEPFTELPYPYITGDYYLISKVAEEGGINYKPDGTSYTGEASTVVETDEVKVLDLYSFDGAVWYLTKLSSFLDLKADKTEVAAELSKKVGIEAQSFTDAQKAQARQNINATAPDGYYGESGGVFQYSTNFLGKNSPQNASDVNFRPTASQMSGQSWSADSISRQTATIDKIKGKTLVFNQLAQNGNFADTTGWGATNATKTIANNICKVTFSNIWGELNNRLSLVDGHKYYIRCFAKKEEDKNCYFGLGNGTNISSQGVYVAIPTSSEFVKCEKIGTYRQLGSDKFVMVKSMGTLFESPVYVKNVVVCDLTNHYGAGNEPSTIKQFLADNPEFNSYVTYNEGELISLNATGLKTVGFNQLYPDGHIDVIAGLTYKIEGTYTSLKDSAGNDVTVTNGEFTPTENDTYTMVGGSCVHLKWSGVRDGDTEEHWNSTLSLPIATYFPDGMKSVGTVYDELTKDKAIKRIDSRAYQSGDESDSTVLTDGTTTYYLLAEPVETPISPELNLTYRCDDFGTEMLLPQNDDEPITAPMDMRIIYGIDYEANIRNLSVNYPNNSFVAGLISAFASIGITMTTNNNYGQWAVALANAGFRPASSAPASATASGEVNQFYLGESVLYICIATNSWISIPYSTFNGVFSDSNIPNLDASKVTEKNAGAHNGVYRGKKLASIPAASDDPYTLAQLSAMVTAGTFDDIFIGDYIQATVTINGTTTTKKWYFAGFDTFLHNGDAEITAHHAVMVPENALFNAQMNSSDTTTGAYKGSAMWTTTMPLVATGIKNAFGAAHVLNHREYITNAMTATTPSMAGTGLNGASTAGEWISVDANPMNEAMVYSVNPCSSSWRDVYDRHEQLPLFRLAPDKICTRGAWWLSAVTSSTNFALVGSYGLATYYDASGSYGVRPYFLFH